MRLSSYLWAIAFGGMGLGALLTSADAEGVKALGVVGLGLWVFAWLMDGREGRGKGRSRLVPRAPGLIAGVLVVALLGEGLTLWETWSSGEWDQALWFAMAGLSALAGVGSVRRGEPSDGTLASQLLFHVVMLVPALAALVDLIVATASGRPPAPTGPLTRLLVIVAGVGLPVVFVGVVAALTFDLSQPRDRRGPACWSVLLAHQATLVVLLMRWAGDGI